MLAMYLWFPLGGRSTVPSSAARLSVLTHQRPRGSPFPAGPHHASRARKRKKRQTPCTHVQYSTDTGGNTDTDVPPSLPLGEGACYRRCHCACALSHGTVPLEQLVSRRRAAKLLRLCPPSPLLPMATGTPTHQRPGTVRPAASGGLAVAPTFERAPLGGGTALGARPAGSTSRCWGAGDTRNACARYSLLADSLPRWYLPEASGQGGDAAGEGGGQGVEGGYAGAASQPEAARRAQDPVPSASASASANAIRAFLFLCSRFI